MPQLTARGIPPEKIASVYGPLVAELADICACGTDNFTIDCLQVVSIGEDGAGAPTFPFVEVGWFDRGGKARDRFAGAVTRHLRAAGVEEVEVAFKTYAPEAYYINGKPCE